MENSNINLSVILPVATKPEQVSKINAELREQGKGPGKSNTPHSSLIPPPLSIISFGSIHPDFQDYKSELKRLKESGIKGLKVHPVYQNTDLDDIKYLRIFETAAALDLIVVTHAGLDIGFPGVVRCTPKMARNVVKEIGDFKFVLAHMGAWRQWDEVPEYLADTKVYLDTAFSTGYITPREGTQWTPEDLKMLDEEQFIELVDIFGADRILFGTDSPWSSQSESIKFIRELKIDDNKKDHILGKNAAQLLGIIQ